MRSATFAPVAPELLLAAESAAKRFPRMTFLRRAQDCGSVVPHGKIDTF
jgi:hypothetical protein